MNPLHLVGEHLRTGRLVELVAQRSLDVPLYWQVAKLPLPELERLSQSVHRVANALLVH
jgi:LysR family transcriptional regulator (chromosome initiation inhibitor)